MTLLPFIVPPFLLPFLFTMNLLERSGPSSFNVENECRLPVELVVRYKNPSGQWRTSNIHGLLPGEITYLGRPGRPLVTKNNIYYYWAESVDGQISWSGRDGNAKDRTYHVEGRDRRFRYRRDRGKDIDLTLACPGQARTKGAFRPKT